MTEMTTSKAWEMTTSKVTSDFKSTTPPKCQSPMIPRPPRTELDPNVSRPTGMKLIYCSPEPASRGATPRTSPSRPLSASRGATYVRVCPRTCHFCKFSVIRVSKVNLDAPPYTVTVRYDWRTWKDQGQSRSVYLIACDEEAVAQQGLDPYAITNGCSSSRYLCAAPIQLKSENGEVTITLKDSILEKGILSSVMLRLGFGEPFNNRKMWYDFKNWCAIGEPQSICIGFQKTKSELRKLQEEWCNVRDWCAIDEPQCAIAEPQSIWIGWKRRMDEIDKLRVELEELQQVREDEIKEWRIEKERLRNNGDKLLQESRIEKSRLRDNGDKLLQENEQMRVELERLQQGHKDEIGRWREENERLNNQGDKLVYENEQRRLELQKLQQEHKEEIRKLRGCNVRLSAEVDQLSASVEDLSEKLDLEKRRADDALGDCTKGDLEVEQSLENRKRKIQNEKVALKQKEESFLKEAAQCSQRVEDMVAALAEASSAKAILSLQCSGTLSTGTEVLERLARTTETFLESSGAHASVEVKTDAQQNISLHVNIKDEFTSVSQVRAMLEDAALQSGVKDVLQTAGVAVERVGASVDWDLDRVKTRINYEFRHRNGEPKYDHLGVSELRALLPAVQQSYDEYTAIWQRNYVAELEKYGAIDAGSFRQGATTVEDLVDDAVSTQSRAKTDLTSGATSDELIAWGKAPFNDRAAVPLKSQSRRVLSSAQHSIPNGTFMDPGIKQRVDLEDKLRAMSMSAAQVTFNKNGPVSKIKDVARLGIVFNDANDLLSAAAFLMQRFGPDRILWLKNKFASPSVLGYRDMNFGISYRAGNDVVGERLHAVEVQLLLQEIFDYKQGDGHTHYETIREILRDAGVADQDSNALQALILEVLGSTEGRAVREAADMRQSVKTDIDEGQEVFRAKLQALDVDEKEVVEEEVKKVALEFAAALQEQVEFENAAATMIGDYQATLSKVSKICKEHPSMKIRVEGHAACGCNGTCGQVPLTNQRAAAVINWLKGDGVKNAMEPFGCGCKEKLGKIVRMVPL